MPVSNAERQRRYIARLKAAAAASAPVEIGAADDVADLQAQVARLEAALAVALSSPADEMAAEYEEEEHDGFLDLVRAHYRKGAEVLASRFSDTHSVADDLRASAWSIFLEGKPLSWVDVLDMAEEAGAKAWVDIFRREASQWDARQPKADPTPATATPSVAPRGRRRSRR
jgi:hypothetical protein